MLQQFFPWPWSLNCLGSPRRGTPPATALARTWWGCPSHIKMVNLYGKLGEMILKDISDLRDGGFVASLFFQGWICFKMAFVRTHSIKKNISVQQKLVGTPVWHVQSYLKLQVPVSIYPGVRIFQDPKSDPGEPLNLVSKKVLITIWKLYNI